MIPSKIITLQTSTVRDRNTLVWLQHQSKDGISWKKWDGVVTSLEAYEEWKHAAQIVGIILTSSVNEEQLAQFFQLASECTLVLVSQSILSCKSEQFWKENFDNLLVLEQLHELYPFVGAPWNQTLEDAVQMFGLICRYHRLVGLSPSSSTRSIQGMTVEEHAVPEELWLFTQYYRPALKKRVREIKECLERNVACPWIDRIVLLNEFDEKEEGALQSPKIHQVVIGERLTYGIFLEYVAEHVPPGIIAVLANSDIYYNDTLRHLWSLTLMDRCYALLRWNQPLNSSPELVERNPYSQDTWIVYSDSIQRRQSKRDDCPILLGKMGCDNAVLSYFLTQRFMISNPALTIQSIHLHRVDFRTYARNEYVPYSFYTHVVPGHILDMKQEKLPLLSPQFICNESVTFTIKGASLSQETLYCTMLEKEGRFSWKAGEAITWFEPAIPLYSWKGGAGVTSNGLVFDLWSIYMGKHVHPEDDRYNYWKTSRLDRFTPLQACDTMLAIPMKDTSFLENPHFYLIHYLSRCLRLRQLFPGASFLVPKEYRGWLESMCSSTSFSSTQTFDPDGATWANHVVGYLPGPLSQEVGRDDVIALQNACSGWWSKTRTSHRCVVMEDEEVMTSEWIQRQLIPFLIKQDARWTVSVVKKKDSIQGYASMRGASLCLFVGGKHREEHGAMVWALPPGATVIEFQQELALSGDAQHLAHVSELSPWIFLLSKGTPSAIQDQLFVQFKRWWKDHSETLASLDSSSEDA